MSQLSQCGRCSHTKSELMVVCAECEKRDMASSSGSLGASKVPVNKLYPDLLDYDALTMYDTHQSLTLEAPVTIQNPWLEDSLEV